MSDDQFTKLSKYMQTEFIKIRANLDETRTELKSDINRVYDLVDKQLKQNETDQIEHLAINRQLDRHEDWIEKASSKLKVSYGAGA